MLSFRSSAQHALNYARRLGPSLGLVAVVLAAMLGASSPVRATNELLQTTGQKSLLLRDDPAARLQVVIKSIYVKNDRDGFWTGDGDLQFRATFWRCSDGPMPCSASNANPAQLMAQWDRALQAASGSTRPMNHLLPLAADVKDGNMTSEEEGLVVQSGRSYVFQVWVWEKDAVGADFMGGIQRVVNESNGWGVGTYDDEPAALLNDGSLRAMDFICAGCGGVIAGDYTISYEIRRTPLADLHATSLRLIDPEPAPGSPDPNVCLTVENIGVADAGPFMTGVAINTTLVPGAVASLPGLAAGGTQESCIHTTFADTGAQQLDLIADVNHAVPESDETNNVVGQAIARALPAPSPAPAGPGAPQATGPGAPQATGPGAPQTTGPSNSGIVTPKPGTPGPRPAPSSDPGDVDLTISTIKVNGQVPDGKNDCKDGKNTVTVVVKNDGRAEANSFGVRLTVDGDDLDGAVLGLSAGQEYEVVFNDVRLKKGEHTLKAVADPAHAIEESKDKNNERKVNARCTDAA